MVATLLVPVQPPASSRGKLGPALDNQPTVGDVDRLPSVYECAVHLELLDAIVHVEGEVVAWGQEEGFAEGVAWNAYCSAAAQRFLKWSHLAEAHKGNTPPLDVLIVWHAYMLNTAAYRRYENKVLKGRMGFKGIDWPAVHRRIDKDNSFNISTEETATMKYLPFPVDLLGALKNKKVKIDSTSTYQSTNFDIVAAVQRQLRFAHKMHNAKWLRSTFAVQILETAIRRYDMFFTLIAEHPGTSLSPTPDIDLVWHTHQLSPRHYSVYSAMKTNGKFINHNDTVGKPVLAEAFHSAEKLFHERFGTEYQVCYCERCMVSRPSGGHTRNDESSDCNGESCMAIQCDSNCSADSCSAECSGESCQSENI
ncbi:hypothetical protein F4777DRAFT_582349 [Nemania sp. FL0916]|nr:hypothetical protein F4777DRAFT_582349 [Nemania sp. FL0916]